MCHLFGHPSLAYSGDMLLDMRALKLRLPPDFDKVFRWSRLRTSGNSPLVRATVAMPVVGYLILLNDNLSHYAELDPRFRMFVSESPVRLLLLYWGFFFLAVASAVYSWRCPLVIKRHESPAEYAIASRDYLLVQANRQQFVRVLRPLALSPEAKEMLSRTEAADLSIQLGSEQSAYGADATLLAAAYWYVSDIQHPWWRLVAGVSFCLGFSFLSVPAADTLLAVLKYSVRVTLAAFW